VKPLLTQLPKGARIYLPDEVARKRHVEARLFDVFRLWGYREIVTPTFEFFDVLAVATDQAVQGNAFTFVDRETGRMLVLRADITPQIARIVATRLRDEPKPLRLSYVTNVFRYDEPQLAHYREFYQAGVELIGLDKPEAEVEILAMTVESLRALGLGRFQLDLGHPDFFRGLMEEVKTDAARERELRTALARKDRSTLERLVDEIAPPEPVGDALLALPTLFGHAEVLERAAPFARNKRAERALANLAEVYRLLTIYGLADAVLLDLGGVRGFDYYSRAVRAQQASRARAGQPGRGLSAVDDLWPGRRRAARPRGRPRLRLLLGDVLRGLRGRIRRCDRRRWALRPHGRPLRLRLPGRGLRVRHCPGPVGDGDPGGRRGPARS